eukprot:COSAG05_NODE_9418_length_625_cov_0.688213_1_plen_194_part_01
MRAPPSRNCTRISSSDAPPHCETPADACAAGWEPCLASTRAEARQHFMAELSREECGGVWGAWAAAMSHAPLDHTNHSDREFCPLPRHPRATSPPPPDNTCRGDRPTSWGAEPLCCGVGCETPTCTTALWPAPRTNNSDGCTPAAPGSAACGTGMARAGSGTCAQLRSEFLDGVLYCRSAAGTEDDEAPGPTSF